MDHAIHHNAYGQQPAIAATQDNQHLAELLSHTPWEDYNSRETLVSLFLKQAASTPGNLAVSFKGHALTYQELDEKSNQLAHYLLAQGVSTGSYVPVYLERSAEWAIAVLGILKTGAAYIPVDAIYPGKRVAFILEEVEAKVIITQLSLGSRLFQVHNTTVVYLDNLTVLQDQPITAPDRMPAPTDLAYIIYTSGSTGQPKGVMISHLSIQHLVCWHKQQYAVNSNSRLSLVAGLAFDISVWECWSALLSGAALFIADSEERTHAGLLMEFYRSNQLTHAFAPAVLLPELVALSRQTPGLMLQYLFSGGEQMKPVLTSGLPYQLIDYYGPTEYTVYATHRPVIDVDGQYFPTIGKPIANTQAFILDRELQLLAPGAVGELCLSGIGIAQGYFKNPALTDSKFVPHPFMPGQRLYRTGDLARRLPDGNIQFLGRIDNQVKIRGFRVEPGEIEAALLQMPHVKSAALIAVDNNRQQQQLVAFIVQDHPNEQQGIALARQQLKQDLPGYMVPARFITVRELPVNANGKVDKAALAALSAQTAGSYQEADELISETERIIAEVWSDILERPYIHHGDNFFDIGGDSLLVATVVTKLKDRFNIKMYLRDLYQYPELRALATMIDNRVTTGDTGIPEEDVEPYVSLQQDAWLLPGVEYRQPFDASVLERQSAILLTGATGFVGIHLLQELLDNTAATVYCLVRARDEHHALDKIHQAFATYHIPVQENTRHRIVAVVGDFAQSSLGIAEEAYRELAAKVEVIYHSGSSVNFIEPYSFMKKPNVDGLREIIRFAATGKMKCLSLLSTISVYSWGHVFTHKTIMKETDDISQNLLAVSKDIGYVRSKWVMEAVADLAAAAGVPVITFRLGYAMCHSQSGASAPYQWWASLVKNCVQYASYPALRELREGLITVDYMAKAIVHITKNKEAIGQKFNLICSPETNLTLEQFFQRLIATYGFNLRPLSYHDWRKQWEDDSTNRLYPLTSLFRDNMHEGLSTVELYQDTYVWHRDNVDKFMQGSGIPEPVFDKAVLDQYLQYLGIGVA
ncbi:amino acid adenylation domain-containing protein/thioester reductase-like protein [Chitinophaga polysaccharea]|uniref:Amino acid adenylation domain-containing protein/thioester reductase-like protein n=1 Tax=Chitinophaga polysaccharea TaxID=1293035 RepID=A0A561PQP4_9BACT|nr:non-ribosomal peptide synthetase [Chitinophaga polysaccharea]TWF40432.1 amino acid adenylation domain-containing protein/thioester reductase-like protein [Chitinophaga polysaccharea]